MQSLPTKNPDMYTDATAHPDDSFDLIDLIKQLWARKFRILFLGILVGSLAFLYVLKPRTHTVEATLQLEAQQSGLSRLVGGSVDIDSQMGILRSWSLVSEAVRSQRNYVSIQHDNPYMIRLITLINSIPLPELVRLHIEDALIPYFYTLDVPTITIDEFHFPASYRSQPLHLISTIPGHYEILTPRGETLMLGQVGKHITAPLPVQDDTGQTHYEDATILVSSLDLPHGRSFVLIPHNHQQMLERMMLATKVTKRSSSPNASLIDVAVSTNRPQFAIHFINTLMQLYIDQAHGQSMRGKRQALAFADNQVVQLEGKIDRLDQELTAFQQEHQLLDIKTTTHHLLTQILQLEKERSDAQLSLDGLRAVYTDKHPAIASMAHQITLIEARIADYEQEAQSLPLTQSTLLRLEREFDRYVTLYEKAVITATELRGELSALTSFAGVVNTPRILRERMLFTVAKFVVLGGILGMLMGAGIVFLQSAPANLRVNSVADLHTYLPDFPIAALVPHSKKAARHRQNRTPILMLIDAKGKALSVIQQLHAQSTYITHGARNNVIMFTSPFDGQGKSFLAANFAVLCGTNKETILVDADMRRSTIHKALNRPDKPGLSDVLVWRNMLEDCIVTITENRLYYLPPGTNSANHRPLYDIERTKELLGELSLKYRRVVIDMPTVNNHEVHRALMELCGAVFHVVKPGHRVLDLDKYFNGLSEQHGTVHSIIFNDVEKPNAKENKSALLEV